MTYHIGFVFPCLLRLRRRQVETNVLAIAELQVVSKARIELKRIELKVETV